jgi:hypothetical protein
MCSTHKDRVNQDLLAFFREPVGARREQLVGSAGRR